MQFCLMKKLDFPNFKFRIKNKENTDYIFDIVRKKWFVLTSEEWVRQHCIHFLVYIKYYPISLINVEKKVLINNLTKRYDIIAYSRTGKVLLIVECKGSNIKISQKTFDQIARYNLVLKSTYLMISNGLSNYFCKVNYKHNNYTFLDNLPEYKSIN